LHLDSVGAQWQRRDDAKADDCGLAKQRPEQQAVIACLDTTARISSRCQLKRPVRRIRACMSFVASIGTTVSMSSSLSPREETSEPGRRSQLRPQTLAPALLVPAEKGLVEPPSLEAFDQRLGGQRCGQ